MLAGSDPKLKDEYVVMSAHLDHVGIGRPVNGDALYNGAMDDASGIASVLEIARLLKESAAKPKRSILFLASPPRRRACSARATSPPTRPCRRKRSSPTSTSTCSCRSMP